ncbi:MAG TPA: tetratricopeptide repeat protein [Phycisphaerae bacterium]|nr:tetratricopeptide repeat protein [Phycisphaerae bacterium]
MTTVPANNLGGSGGKGPPRGIARELGAGGWNRLWQVPLLLAGLAAFGFGLRALVKVFKPVPFESQVAGLNGLLQTGKYTETIDEINKLALYYKKKPEQAELQRIAGDAFYLAQKAQSGFVRENYQHVAEHYEIAVKLGYVPDATVNERWGEAELALGDANAALEKLQAAIAADPTKLQSHVRDLVSAHVGAGNFGKAVGALDALLKQKQSISLDDRVWALCRKIEIAMESGTGGAELEHAVEDARAALPEVAERDPNGRLLLWIGRAEHEDGKLNEAQRDLTKARQQFVARNLDDARAAILLAKIAETRNDLDTAGTLFQDVVTHDIGTSVWAAARLGRAEVLAMKKTPDDQMQTDYRFVISRLQEAGGAPTIDDLSDSGNHRVPEMVRIDQVRGSLVAEYQRYADADRLRDALLFLTLQKEINEPETAATAYRLATTKERLAAQLKKEMNAAPDGATREARKREATSLLVEAADDYLRHAKLTTMEDSTSGDSLWRAAHLYDAAGETNKAIAVYEKFTTERPRDPRTPEGLLDMGVLYQSVGKLNEALDVYQQNIRQNPHTPAAYTSAVNTARCYMTLGTGPGNEANFEKAEKSLLTLVQDNSDLLPTASEFRNSLFTLGELYYRSGRWADAILRLEETAQRYPNDPEIGSALFMLAESYRKSAADIADAIRKNPGIEHREALEQARTDRLARAALLFSRVISTLENGSDGSGAADASLTPLEEQYLHSSYMDRAETYYERGDYPAAIKLYDQTATRFAQKRVAIEAYVQIVNGYLTMGQTRQADAAAERAQWILKRIPDEALAAGPVPSDRQYFVNFFNLNRLHQVSGGG